VNIIYVKEWFEMGTNNKKEELITALVKKIMDARLDKDEILVVTQKAVHLISRRSPKK
jgi:hypothetical protein